MQKIRNSRGVFRIHAVLVGAVSLLAVLPPGSVHAQEGGAAGVIRGTVRDKDFGDPLSEARVTVQELGLTGTSEAGGVYRIENLPEGVYTVTVAKPGYIRAIQRDVIVRPGQVTDANLSLEQEVYELEPLVVQAEDLLGGSEVALLELRQDTSSLMDSVGRDLISKAGASDAGDALKLVVGTTVQDGKYATVRGLADRYTRTLVNGMSVPSPDPEKRAVQVDIFPASSLDSLNVSKTFTPDMPGDASGGLVDIRLKSIPDGRTIKVSGKVGYNSNTTFKNDFVTYSGGGVNYLGIDGKNRDFPTSIADVKAAGGGGFPQINLGIFNPATPQYLAGIQAVETFSKDFQKGLGPKLTSSGPDHGYGVSLGDKLDLGDGAEMGVFFAYNYDKKFRTTEGEKSTYRATTTPTVELARDGVFRKSVEEVLWSSLFNVGWKPTSDHELSVSLGHNQAADDSAETQFLNRVAVGPDRADGFNNAFHYTERTLSNVQVRSTSTFSELNDIELDVKAGFARGSQSEPDIRLIEYFFDTTTGQFTFEDPISTNPRDPDQAAQRFWRHIEEWQYQASLDLKVPFETWVKSDKDNEPELGSIKFGPHWETLERDFDQTVFSLQAGPAAGFAPPLGIGVPVTDIGGDPNQFDADNRLGVGGTNLAGAPTTAWYWGVPQQGPADYQAEQLITAFYGMMELPVTPKLRTTVGARVESTNIDLLVTPSANGFGSNLIKVTPPGGGITGFRVGPVLDKTIPASINQVDLLPAVNFTYEVQENMNIRASWSQTVARPTFRELAPVVQIDALGGQAFIGNENLEMSKINNYDFRWEWFPNPGDVFATSIFYKEILNPIELTGINTEAQDYLYPQNFEQGRLFGVEFEARKNLNFIGESFQYFTLGSNFTLIDSEVELPQGIRNSLQAYGISKASQPLSGQPNFLFNANISFDQPEWGTGIGLFFNWEAESLIAGAVGGENFASLDAYKEANHSLNISVSQKLTRIWTIKLGIKNILNPEIRTYFELPDGQRLPRSTYRKGVDASLSLSAEF